MIANDVRKDFEGGLYFQLESRETCVVGRDGNPEALGYGKLQPGMVSLRLDSLTLEQLVLVSVLIDRQGHADETEVERLARKICGEAFKGFDQNEMSPTGSRYRHCNDHECMLVERAYKRAAELLKRHAEAVHRYVGQRSVGKYG